MDEKSTGIEVK